MRPRITPHPNAPAALVGRYCETRSTVKIAKDLGLNPGTVWAALARGKRPRNRRIAAKLGYEIRHRRPLLEWSDELTERMGKRGTT